MTDRQGTSVVDPTRLDPPSLVLSPNCHEQVRHTPEHESLCHDFQSNCHGVVRQTIDNERLYNDFHAKLEWLVPDWPAPPWVRAVATTRRGGVSLGAYAGLNLGDHVGDDPARVQTNRQLLRAALRLPAEPVWLRQVHGCAVACVAPGGVPGEAVGGTPDQVKGGRPSGAAGGGQDAAAGKAQDGATEGTPGEADCEADAAVAYGPGSVCAVLTADCLPLLLTDRAGTRVAAIHAGWRGLAAGVIEAAVARLVAPPGDVLAWLGPAIGAAAFEVGGEVRARFVAADARAAAAFTPLDGDKWLADLYRLARQRLAALGVEGVWGGDQCTYRDPERFYSYRRDGVTGRMASLIWLEASDPLPFEASAR